MHPWRRICWGSLVTPTYAGCPAGLVIRAHGRPARVDRVKDDQPVEVQRRHFQQRKRRVREGGEGKEYWPLLYLHILIPKIVDIGISFHHVTNIGLQGLYSWVIRFCTFT